MENFTLTQPHLDLIDVNSAQWSKTSVRGGKKYFETPHHPRCMKYNSFSFSMHVQKNIKKLSLGIFGLLRKFNFLCSESLI